MTLFVRTGAYFWVNWWQWPTKMVLSVVSWVCPLLPYLSLLRRRGESDRWTANYPPFAEQTCVLFCTHSAHINKPKDNNIPKFWNGKHIFDVKINFVGVDVLANVKIWAVLHHCCNKTYRADPIKLKISIRE